MLSKTDSKKEGKEMGPWEKEPKTNKAQKKAKQTENFFTF